MLATVVDVETLLKVAGVSLLAGVGVTTAFSLAIVGATRMIDMRRDGRGTEAGAYAVLMIAGLLTTLGSVAFGVVIMTTK